MNKRDELWWRHGIFYQIYPRSFQDSNADGVGDIRGIIDRLPYLQALGVDALWLSPIFPSPMADFGYDIADYTGVDPLFGSMEDFDVLVKATHAAGLKIILDLVPNHTSDRHPWFIESRRSRDDPKRDWYIWREPAAGGGPPNNWLSEFGGSAWQYDTASRQYYYHAFLAQQPDLNWRNPAVRHAIYDVMRFWLCKGVDGFRVDVIWHLVKDAQFRDNPPNPNFRDGRPPHEKILPLHSTDQPEIHDVIAEMRRVVDEFDARVLIGEIYLPLERLVVYYGRDLSGAHLPFNFALLSAPWNATPNAGFSTSPPWLPVADDFFRDNVVNLDADSRSILSLYKALIGLRKKLPQLVSGAYVPMAAEGDLLLYRRESEGRAVVVALNLGAEPVSIASDALRAGGAILLSTFLDRQGEKTRGSLDLRGNEGVIIGA